MLTHLLCFCSAPPLSAGKTFLTVPFHLLRVCPVLCSVLLVPEARCGYPLSDYVQQLQNELESQALTRQKLEEKIDSILRRGGTTELKSSQAMINELQGPLTDAIIREQRSVGHCHRSQLCFFIVTLLSVSTNPGVTSCSLNQQHLEVLLSEHLTSSPNIPKLFGVIS